MTKTVAMVPDTQRATGSYPIRFEDLAQDGRVHFEPIVASIDAAIWRPMLNKSELTRSLYAAGVRPIFTRLELEVGTARLELGSTLTAEGAYELSHEPDGRGGAARLFLNMWTTIRAEPTRHRPERPDVGRLFAEHQLTRIHAPPGERRVTRLPADPPVPPAEYRSPPPASMLDLPEGCAWLDPDLSADVAPVRFGLSHTDVNQHVNSLVYPRLFGDAALRRFASHGEGTRTLASRLEIAFRKPFFAGDEAAIELRAFKHVESGELGAAGTFATAGGGGPDRRPHVFVRLRFARTSARISTGVVPGAEGANDPT